MAGNFCHRWMVIVAGKVNFAVPKGGVCSAEGAYPGPERRALRVRNKEWRALRVRNKELGGSPDASWVFLRTRFGMKGAVLAADVARVLRHCRIWMELG